MGIFIGDNFKYFGKKFLDDRQQFTTLEAMKNCINVPNGFITYCLEDNKRYEFQSSNIENEITGKWSEFIIGTTDEEKETINKKIDDIAVNEIQDDNGNNIIVLSFYSNLKLIKTISFTDKDTIGMTEEEREILDNKIDDVTVETIENDDKTTVTKLTFLANNESVKSVQFSGGNGVGMTDEERDSLNNKFDNVDATTVVEDGKKFTKLTFYSDDTELDSVQFTSSGSGSNSNIHVGNDEPEDEDSIWLSNGVSDVSPDISLDHPLIKELFVCINTLQEQVKQLQSDVEYLKVNGGGSRPDNPDDPDNPIEPPVEESTYSLIMEDGFAFLLEDGGKIILEEQELIVPHDDSLALEDGGLFLFEDGSRIILEHVKEVNPPVIESNVILLENGSRLLYENGKPMELEK